jgi:hypothetical protein
VTSDVYSPPPRSVAMQVEGDSLLIGRHIHHSAFALADRSSSHSDEEEVGQQRSTCSALPRGAEESAGAASIASNPSSSSVDES